MRLLLSLATLISLSFALPIDNAAIKSEAQPNAHPAIATFNYVSNQLATVITEINQFDWRDPKTDRIYRHAMETLESLKRGNQEVKNGPELDFWGTSAFTPALLSLNLQMHSMANALNSKKSDIDKAGVGLVFYTLLKETYFDSVEMRVNFIQKMPSFLTSVTKPVIDEVVGVIEKARDYFKPAEGDLEVIVVTDPRGPVSPIQPASLSDSWGSPSNRPFSLPVFTCTVGEGCVFSTSNEGNKAPCKQGEGCTPMAALNSNNQPWTIAPSNGQPPWNAPSNPPQGQQGQPQGVQVLAQGQQTQGSWNRCSVRTTDIQTSEDESI
jgi:hypothetical protein